MKRNLFSFIHDMKIQYKIGSGFLLCALLFLGNYILIKYIQGIDNKEGRVIMEIAGRNRMLSQKIAVDCESLFRGNEQIRSELMSDIELYEKSLMAIKKGGEAPNAGSNILLPPAPDEVLPAINETEDFWKKFRASAEKITAAGDMREARNFISENYSEMLKRNSDVARSFSKYFSDRKADMKLISATSDIAARNKMLSQRIGLICLRKFSEQVSPEEENELKKAIALHQQSLMVLKDGGVSPETELAAVLPPAPVEVLPAIAKTEELWAGYKKNAEVLLSEKDNIKAIEFIESGYSELLKRDASLISAYSGFLEKQRDEIISQLNFYLSIVLVFNLIMAAGAIWLTLQLISKPITSLARVVDQVAEGDLSQNTHYEVKDEIGLVSVSVNKLIDNQKKAADFAVHIGDGKFDDEFTPVSEKDTLGISLINMRDKLKAMSLEDKKRNWATEGLAKFGEILRLNNDNLQVLGNDIISNLVKYMKANQGGLFIINDNNPSDTSLELMACYAFDRKKYVSKKITMGEGLVGQAWQEGEYIYLTDVPNDYVHITSGLGEANPGSILIMPLKVNEKTFGVIEIASFKAYEIHEIEFVQKLSESIASTISTAKINERTKRLLHESQQQAEELKAQEEEMRQNMEEMTATQEEMQRKEAELQRTLEHSKEQEEEMRQNMEAMAATQEEILRYKEESETQRRTIHSMAVFSKTDISGNITYVNDEFLKWSKYSREEIIGQNHRLLKSGRQKDEFYKNLWSTISSGKIWRDEIKNRAKDGSHYWVDTVISPILDKNGKPKEYVSEGFIITHKKQQEELLIKELEELKGKNNR